MYSLGFSNEHRDKFEFDSLTSGDSVTAPVRTYWGVILVLTPIVLTLYLLGQLAGFLPVGRADIAGHLIGFSLGMGYAMVRSRMT